MPDENCDASSDLRSLDLRSLVEGAQAERKKHSITRAILTRRPGSPGLGVVPVVSLDEIYSQQRGPIFRYFYNLTSDLAVAEELTQETFARAAGAISSFRGDSTVPTWLRGIAKHVFQKHRRRLDRDRANFQDGDIELLSLNGLTGDPAAALESKEQGYLVHQVLSSLPQSYRTIILLREAERLAYKDIARTLGISVSAVKTTLHRARNRFKDVFRALTQE